MHTPTHNARNGTLVVWAVVGVSTILSMAVFRLFSRGWPVVSAGLEPVEWVGLAIALFAFVYGEGVVALQRRWVPRILRRSQALGPADHPALRVGAPLYAMGLLGGPARSLVRSWLGVIAIVAAVLVVRALPEPWRGIVDVSVAGALAWGVISLLRASRHPKDHPEPAPERSHE
ncbi:MAG: hypothetical protein AAF389_15155 [Gemmatimonadota bacterium]